MTLNRAVALGEIVCDKADPRHLGVVIGFTLGHAIVRWEDTRWISEVPVGSLAPEAGCAACGE